ncbi:MAG: chorismate synthase [Clostridia bacterium]|nr:chorismate synthase [Clostridia bacterium]
MKNTFGSSIAITLFGESHGYGIGAVLDGMPAGIKVDTEYIEKKLTQRRPGGSISTARVEKDNYRLVSGVFNGYTTGAPVTILIENENTHSKSYEGIKNTPRPSHADYAARCKYRGFEDYRGGGHFSGRITAALVAAGAVIGKALLDKGIQIGTHIANLHGVCDREFEDYRGDLELLANKQFAVLSDEAEEKMVSEIIAAKNDGDSVGGVLESVILGVPAGVGEPWFDSMEGVISHMLFSIGGIKGIEFGRGFEFADMYGSEANDSFVMEDNRVVTKTNHNGGINGGITNGMPLTLRCVVKPTPSVYKEQQTVNLQSMTNEILKIEGRHDPAIIHRARGVVDAALAIVVADMLTLRFGTDYLVKNAGE